MCNVHNFLLQCQKLYSVPQEIPCGGYSPYLNLGEHKDVAYNQKYLLFMLFIAHNAIKSQTCSYGMQPHVFNSTHMQYRPDVLPQ